MGERSSSTTRGFAILSLAGILSKLLSLLYVPILQSIIGIEGYGIYAKTYDVFTFFYALTNIGMPIAIAKYVSELTALGQHRDANRAFKISRTLLLFAGTIATIILISCAKLIAYKTDNPNIVYGIIGLAPAVAITSVLGAYRGYFQGKNLMTPIAISTVLEQFINTAVSILGAFFLIKYGVEMGSAGGTIGTSIGALIAVYFLIYVYMKRKLDVEAVRLDVSKKRTKTSVIVKKIFKYGFPITLSAGMQNFGVLVDMFNVNSRLLVAGFQNAQANTLYGILGFYKSLLYVPLTIILALATAVLPAVTKAFILKDKKSLKDNLIFTIRISFAIAIPSAVAFSVLSREIYLVLYDKTKGYELMFFGSVVVVFMAMVQIQSTILQSINKFYFLIGSLATGIVLKIVCNYILVSIPSINIYGAVIGGAVCFFIPMILNHRKICSTVKVKISLLKLLIKPLISSAVMALVLFVGVFLFKSIGLKFESRMTTIIPFTVLVVMGGLSYLFVMIYIGGVRKKEIESVSPKVVNLIPGFMKKFLK